MTRKPRRLHSVPTGADVDVPNESAPSNSVAPLGGPASTPPLRSIKPPALVGLDSETGPASIPGWPFPLVDLSSLTADDVATLMDRISQFSQDGRFHTGPQQSPTPSRRRPRSPDQVTLRLRVDLDGIEPPIWRQFEIASHLTLDGLHKVLQSLFGWQDAHLHSFLSGDSRHDHAAERYLTRFDVAEGDEGVLETDVRLDELFVDPGDKLFYTYDFGDCWEHTLVLESTVPRSIADPVARCVSGRRSGPPEDSGGIWGYQEMHEWAEPNNDPERLDLAAVNEDLDLLHVGLDVSTPAIGAAMRDASPHRFGTDLPGPLAALLGRSSGPAGATLAELLSSIDLSASISLPPQAAEDLTRRYWWLLHRVGRNGLPLTAAGYLKPADVSAAFTELDLGAEWIGAGNREVHSLPVLQLRESAQRLGLVRKLNGRLLQTKAGAAAAGEPFALLEWIASRLPLGKSPQERDAGLALLTVVCAVGSNVGAGADREVDQLVAEVLSGVGWRDHDGRPISAMMANLTAELTETVLVQLGALRRLPGLRRRAITAEGAEFARLALIR